MKNIFKKEELTEQQKKLNELKEDLRYCQQQMKRTRILFDMTTDENLIEARIYEMKSLAKHYDYIVGSIRTLTDHRQESRTVNA